MAAACTSTPNWSSSTCAPSVQHSYWTTSSFGCLYRLTRPALHLSPLVHLAYSDQSDACRAILPPPEWFCHGSLLVHPYWLCCGPSAWWRRSSQALAADAGLQLWESLWHRACWSGEEAEPGSLHWQSFELTQRHWWFLAISRRQLAQIPCLIFWALLVFALTVSA